MRYDAILFDKDGTLFDFGGTWNVWAANLLKDLSGGDPALKQDLADRIHFDLDSVSFRPDSPVIAGTNREASFLLQQGLPDRSIDDLDRFLAERAALAPLVPAVPLAGFLDSLAARSLRLGVMTNDAEISAHAQLRAAGVLERFDFVAGADSGHGAKPSPDPLLAFCRSVGVAPGRTVMVGDSTHDLIAGRAAGMTVVAVLTGPAEVAELQPHADVVLPDIGHLPEWLDA
ncbi:HAD family hydrolase [Chachezhania antarctica]|uniref:HAD family hydrolase n=1 Tax=Chachezhania antarctica TaxID=2340860 RepID=UPI000EACE17D|nr:HAD family hydrolase [Chachezhania antarctica]